MVPFTGRSSHTVMIRAKPIPQGYKILALCEREYTNSFIFTSWLDKFSNLNRTLYNGPSRQNLSPTSHAVFQLVSALPYITYRFILYTDNYFSNIPLFKALREYSIGACGTTRPTLAFYLQLFKIDKRKRCLPWNTISAIKHSDVLVVLWQDKNLVRFLTTSHTCTPEPENFTRRLRRQPRITEANQHLIEAGWGNDAHRELLLPRVSVDYNDYGRGWFGRSMKKLLLYSTSDLSQLVPPFFCLLDTAVINAFFLSHKYLSSPTILESHERYWAHHGMFWTRLAWNLVLEGFRLLNPDYKFQIRTLINPNHSLPSSLPVGNGRYCLGAIPKENNSHSRYRGYVSKNYQLNSRSNLKFPEPHAIEHGRKKLCLFGRYLAQHPELYPLQPAFSSSAL